MAKTVAVKKHFTFVKGLNTEGSFLTVAPNTWSEGDNVVPSVDGSIVLRSGVDYEASYELSSAFNETKEATGAFVVGEWNNVAGNGNLHFVVVQRESTLTFYVNSGATISNQDKSFTVDLATYKAATNPETSGVAPIATANVLGKLLVVSRDTEPLLVTYDESADTISVETVVLKIRDFTGLDDSLDVDERPGVASQEHLYNLHNQGWSGTHISTYQAGTGVYPSNAQIWTAGKDSSDNFSQALLDKQDFGTSPAPKGRFILELFNRDRNAASGFAVTTEQENYRPTTCAFFAGRAWYAGVRSGTIGTWVMFSQVAETSDKLGKCYQDADPTSEVISDLIPSDGGVIPIQDAGSVLRLVPFGSTLLVICDNGIWQIVGGSDTGFGADAYEVRKLASVGCVSAKSVVLTEQAVLFWGEEAIYSVEPNENGLLGVSSLTAESIQTFYNDIPMTGKTYASGVYVPQDRTVYWVYNADEEQDGIVRRFKKDSLLVLDLGVPSFYTMTIGELETLSPYMVDLFVTKSRASAATVFNVVDSNGDNVVDELGTPDQVVATQNPGLQNPILLKFLVVHPESTTSFKLTMAQFDNENDTPRRLRDWYSKDSAGLSFTGYVIPGYDFGNQEEQGADRAFQALYVHVFMRRTETGVNADGTPINPSSCAMQARWDWADSNTSNRWSSEQEVYRHTRAWLPAALPSADYDNGFPVVVTKNKVRGRGKVLQLKFTSAEDHDMQILGWAITYIGNANI